MKLFTFLSTILLGLVFVHSATANEVCHACVERKRGMCAKECELVPADKSLVCQRDCAFQYCSHRCKANDEAFSNFKELGCVQCLDQQFGVCSASCPIGSDRSRAMCQIECSDKRCQDKCLGKPASGPPQSPDDLEDEDDLDIE